MALYRRIPTTTEAIQFTGDNFEEIIDEFGETGIRLWTSMDQNVLIIKTTDGVTSFVRQGDWIIPDKKPNTFYPCKPDIFKATYELVEE